MGVTVKTTYFIGDILGEWKKKNDFKNKRNMSDIVVVQLTKNVQVTGQQG